MAPSSASTSVPGWRVEALATLRLAGPLALANLLQMAIHAVDVVFVARLGPEVLAAASLGMAVYGLVLWALTGLNSAVAALIAQELGQRRHSVREVRRTVRMGLWTAAISGAVGMLACLLGEPLMRATGQDRQVAAAAADFLAILSLGMVPMVMASTLRNFLAALGRPGIATVITALMIAVNAAGNWLLVFGNWGFPALGLTGSAISSVITSCAFLAAYVLVIARDRRLRRFAIWGRWWRFEADRFAAIWRIGGPIAITIVAEGGIFNAAAFMMGAISPLALAAHTLALQIAAIAFQLPAGIGQAATIRVGFHFGAGDRAAVRRAGWVAIATGTAVMGLTALAMLLAPRLLLSAYVDIHDPANAAMLALAVPFLGIAAAFQLFDGAQAVALGALRGVQDTAVPMALALFGYWVPGLAICLVLGFATPLAGLGIWIGLAAGLMVVAALLIGRWARISRA